MPKHLENDSCCCVFLSKIAIKIQFYILHFQQGASAEQFFVYLIQQILPHFNECGDSKLDVLKLLAEMSPCGLNEDTTKSAVEPVFNLLLVIMEIFLKKYPYAFSFSFS